MLNMSMRYGINRRHKVFFGWEGLNEPERLGNRMGFGGNSGGIGGFGLLIL